jgi:twitching motility protein PilT
MKGDMNDDVNDQHMNGDRTDDDTPPEGVPLPETPEDLMAHYDFGGMDLELGSLLVTAVLSSASDLHLNVGRPPSLRIDGQLVDDTAGVDLTGPTISRMIRSLLDDERWNTFLSDRQVDFSATVQGLGRFRVNAYHQLGTPAAAFRTIANTVPTTADLGVPEDVERVASYPYGLVLFVGPTGSGKSTTQAALLSGVNRDRACHIVTIEDPVEYIHPRAKAVISQREVGTDVLTFADGLRAALREDPDVILVGEMRDEESIAITLTLAETGHLVFATLHTNDAAQAIDRIVDSYPSDRREQIQTQLSSALQAVVSQRLVPRVGGGRVAAFEVMLGNDAVRNLIREGKTRQLRNVLTTSTSEGMRTMEHSLNGLVVAGVVDYEVACGVTQFAKEIKDPAAAQIIAAVEAAAAASSRR